MEMIDIIYVIGNVFQVLAFEMYFENTMKRKFNKHITLIVMMLVLISSDFLLELMNGGSKIVMAMIITFITIFFLYDNSITKIIIVLILVTIFQLISEMLSALILSICITQDKNNYLVGYVLSKILFLLVLRIIKLRNKSKDDSLMGSKTLMSIVAIPVLSIIMIVLCYDLKLASDISIKDVLFCSIIFLINYINIIQYENVQKMLKLQRNNELLMEQKKSYLFQYEQNQKNMDSIMRIKHNIKNDYIRQKIMLDNKDYDGLMELYRQKVNNVESVVQESNTGNNVFDSVINYKLSEIKKHDVKYDVNISIPQVLNVEDEDIILILGNLLDNVGEAFEKCEGIEKHGKLNILYDKGMLYIETGNSFSKKLNKDREGKIRSTKKDSDWHGIGLRAIEEIVEKYNGDMIITDENNYFTVKIIMEM